VAPPPSAWSSLFFADTPHNHGPKEKQMIDSFALRIRRTRSFYGGIFGLGEARYLCTFFCENFQLASTWKAK